MPAHRSFVARILALTLALLVVGCAGQDPEGERGARYRVIWSAERASDHAPLAASSANLRLGGLARVKTGERQATEDRPAVTEFTAALHLGSKPGVVEVIPRAAITELYRTPKGKLKRKKRSIGALLPMRPGEKHAVSSGGDPITVSVQLERAPSR